tara:strand:+ start:464 stop:565 length:102 start_codon:yes stop_codon:yes gene_type:complete
MSEDFKDPKVIGGLILAIILCIATVTIIVVERF